MQMLLARKMHVEARRRDMRPALTLNPEPNLTPLPTHTPNPLKH